ncbi:FAD binding domain-containing protein [Halobacillus salinarum]|uniref:FAD binding domain-containing protein n=1 Tax=Halobacillus salinarum TaxID=2932257 RepID=A0ABY4EGV7_9BACI|nr:FAD binding domain-containing protein [Halobacillus salinarum]UOQ43701.1 FAD binding domain-containing protein [Halobacillus salinarum]
MDNGVRSGLSTQLSNPNQLYTKVWHPGSVEEAWRLKRKFGEHAAYIAGGTVLQLMREKGIALPGQFISLASIEGMKGIDKSTGNLIIGALTSLKACQKHPSIRKSWQVLSTAIDQVASPAVRNQAAIGGNVAYGIGDLIPALLVINAHISWFDGKEMHVESLHDFVSIPKRRDELITAFFLPIPSAEGEILHFYKKVGRREGFIPSLVTVAGSIRIDSNHKVTSARFAIGGGKYLPHRLETCESLLLGKQLDDKRLLLLEKEIIRTYRPAPTPFTSGEYCTQVAANLIVSELEEWIAQIERS